MFQFQKTVKLIDEQNKVQYLFIGPYFFYSTLLVTMYISVLLYKKLEYLNGVNFFFILTTLLIKKQLI